MNVRAAIRDRRSIKRYAPVPVSRERIESLLDAAIRAPNHRMTEPWRFYVLGPESRDLYARLRARLKSSQVENADARDAVRRKVEAEAREIPTLVAVGSRLDEDPGIREEDFAATWMGVQNLLLAAWEMNLGGYIRTGAILELDELRSGLGVPDDERLLCIVQLGQPTEVGTPVPRAPAAARTRWTE